MNTSTLLAFASNIGRDVDMINEILTSPRTQQAQIASETIGTNLAKFYHENFDLIGKLMTSYQDITTYGGDASDAIKCLIEWSFADWYKQPSEVRDELSYKMRGVDFNEMVRRDFMRSVCNTEWLYNKQVFEFSDELLYSLLSDTTIVNINDLIERSPHIDISNFPKESGNIQFIEMKLFIDRINLLPFKTFVLDVSDNRIFKGCGFNAIQITPLYYPENYRVLIHTEIISTDGSILGSYTYDIDYTKKQNCIFEDNGMKYATALAFTSKEISDVLSGRSGATRFNPEMGVFTDPYNTIVGVVICQVINYLGADDTDIEESSDTKKTYRPTNPVDVRIRNTYREIQKWDCGFHYAESVKRYKESKEVAINEGAGTPKRPHVRKAHWHHYWIGSGNSRRLIRKWLPAINVKMNFHSDLVLTIRKKE